MRITAPNPDYTGIDVYGTTSVEFKNGVAEVDELPAAVRNYMQGVGYGIDGEPADAVPAPVPPDPRELGDGRIGTPLRDAAVDPKPEDFLAPTNTGVANPHGPDVVSPELHGAQGVHPVTPGDVAVDDLDAQEAKEKAAATEVTSSEPPAGTPLTPEELAEAARHDATPEATTTPAPSVEKPAGNASQEAWAAYAIAAGVPAEEAAAASRNELRDRFTV